MERKRWLKIQPWKGICVWEWFARAVLTVSEGNQCCRYWPGGDHYSYGTSKKCWLTRLLWGQVKGENDFYILSLWLGMTLVLFMLMIRIIFHRHFAYFALLFVLRGGDRFKLGKLSQTENLKSYPLFVFLRDHFSTVEKKIILQSTVALKKSYTERVAHLFPNR